MAELNDDDFDWDSLDTAVPYRPVPRHKRIIWEPSDQERELADLRGTVPCSECNDPVELHDRHGCRVCDDCPQTWTTGDIKAIRLAHGLRWARG